MLVPIKDAHFASWNCLSDAVLHELETNTDHIEELGLARFRGYICSSDFEVIMLSVRYQCVELVQDCLRLLESVT